MLEFRAGEPTVVRRLRVGGAGPDALAARLRAESAFASLDLGAAGLAPSAVLCIRALADPRPRSCKFGAGGFRLPAAWRDSVRAEIERKARGAARPAREAVAASADCVLFADASELLACAAEDWLAGSARSNWWWKSLLGAAAGARVSQGLWLRAPEYVPAALEQLAGKGKAAAFARQLPPGEARAILRRVNEAFRLSDLDRALSRDAGADAQPTHGTSPRDARADAHSRARADAGPPWREIVPECAGLDPAGESLLGVSLSLSRAPSLVRRADFARRVAVWSARAANADAARPAGSEPPRDPRAQSSDAGTADSRARVGDEKLTGPARDARDERAGRRPQPTHPADATRRPARDQGGGTEDASARRGGRGGVGEGGKASAGDDAGVGLAGERVEVAGAGDAARASVARESEFDPRERVDESRAAGDGAANEMTRESRDERAGGEAYAAPLVEAEIETRFGGLFHLVNLALYLNLYGDFTAPAEPGLPLSPWDFVALLGRRLCGARVETDAVWPLLARLAGRGDPAEPGADFSPPDEWRVAPDWLKHFGDTAVLRWNVAAGRLRVAHPAGFLLIDVPADAVDGGAQANAGDDPHELLTNELLTHELLTRELRPYAEAGARFGLRRVARLRGARGRTPRARWLDRLSAYAVARLSLALGARGPARLSRLLCERRARVFVTAAHVDVVMRLAELPVEVRFAGLDRDPGWVPAAGRHVAFHFE